MRKDEDEEEAERKMSGSGVGTRQTRSSRRRPKRCVRGERKSDGEASAESGVVSE